MRESVSVYENQKDKLAIEEAGNVDQPYTHCGRRNKPISVPNSNPDSDNERCALESSKQHVEHIRAEHNQQRSRGTGSDSKDLGNMMGVLP
jgi:hypothetical protein